MLNLTYAFCLMLLLWQACLRCENSMLLPKAAEKLVTAAVYT